jgi:archaellum component FlaC
MSFTLEGIDNAFIEALEERVKVSDALGRVVIMKKENKERISILEEKIESLTRRIDKLEKK